MKKIMVAMLAMSLALPLGSCATMGGGGTGGIVTQIQQLAAQVCGFLPTATSVAAIIAAAAGLPGAVTGIEGIANAICAQVTKPTTARRGAPTVNGVLVSGTFVR